MFKPQGAVIGLEALGHATVSKVLVPLLQPYLARLQPLLEGASARQQQTTTGPAGASASGTDVTTTDSRRSDAFRVHGALLSAVSSALYERIVAAAAMGLPTTMKQPKRKCVKRQ